MEQFIEQYKDQSTGVLNGFDRLVCRGSLRRLNYGWRVQFEHGGGASMEEYLWRNKILFKDYCDHVRGAVSGLGRQRWSNSRRRRYPWSFCAIRRWTRTRSRATSRRKKE